MTEPILTSYQQLEAWLGRISFENTGLAWDWHYEITPVSCAGWNTYQLGYLIQLTFKRPDTSTGVMGVGRSREEIVWAGASLSSVIKTAWLLAEVTVRHELMEAFRFDGARIFNPHNSVLDLAQLQRNPTNDLAS